jgi:hypothetical protein
MKFNRLPLSRAFPELTFGDETTSSGQSKDILLIVR